MKPIAIDLGRTFWVMARTDTQGQPEVASLGEGGLIPAAVSEYQGEILLGQALSDGAGCPPIQDLYRLLEGVSSALEPYGDFARKRGGAIEIRLQGRWQTLPEIFGPLALWVVHLVKEHCSPDEPLPLVVAIPPGRSTANLHTLRELLSSPDAVLAGWCSTPVALAFCDPDTAEMENCHVLALNVERGCLSLGLLEICDGFPRLLLHQMIEWPMEEAIPLERLNPLLDDFLHVSHERHHLQPTDLSHLLMGGEEAWFPHICQILDTRFPGRYKPFTRSHFAVAMGTAVLADKLQYGGFFKTIIRPEPEPSLELCGIAPPDSQIQVIMRSQENSLTVPLSGEIHLPLPGSAAEDPSLTVSIVWPNGKSFQQEVAVKPLHADVGESTMIPQLTGQLSGVKGLLVTPIGIQFGEDGDWIPILPGFSPLPIRQSHRMSWRSSLQELRVIEGSVRAAQRKLLGQIPLKELSRFASPQSFLEIELFCHKESLLEVYARIEGRSESEIARVMDRGKGLILGDSRSSKDSGPTIVSASAPPLSPSSSQPSGSASSALSEKNKTPVSSSASGSSSSLASAPSSPSHLSVSSEPASSSSRSSGRLAALSASSPPPKAEPAKSTGSAPGFAASSEVKVQVAASSTALSSAAVSLAAAPASSNKPTPVSGISVASSSEARLSGLIKMSGSSVPPSTSPPSESTRPDLAAPARSGVIPPKPPRASGFFAPPPTSVDTSAPWEGGRSAEELSPFALAEGDGFTMVVSRSKLGNQAPPSNVVLGEGDGSTMVFGKRNQGSNATSSRQMAEGDGSTMVFSKDALQSFEDEDEYSDASVTRIAPLPKAPPGSLPSEALGLQDELELPIDLTPEPSSSKARTSFDQRGISLADAGEEFNLVEIVEDPMFEESVPRQMATSGRYPAVPSGPSRSPSSSGSAGGSLSKPPTGPSSSYSALPSYPGPPSSSSNLASFSASPASSAASLALPALSSRPSRTATPIGGLASPSHAFVSPDDPEEHSDTIHGSKSKKRVPGSTASLPMPVASALSFAEEARHVLLLAQEAIKTLEEATLSADRMQQKTQAQTPTPESDRREIKKLIEVGQTLLQADETRLHGASRKLLQRLLTDLEDQLQRGDLLACFRSALQLSLRMFDLLRRDLRPW